MTRLRSLIFLLSFSFLLAGCVSLAADVTPPPDYRPTQPVQPVAIETVYPLVPPDPANGAAIYADKCTACHGETGMSDGPMAEQLPEPAPELGNPEVARRSRPVDWFLIVSRGNLEKLMPNFDGTLSERERWDVVSYLYLLGMPEDAPETGAAVYAENCQSCHGPDGEGDGPQAGDLPVPNWKQEPARLAQLSDLEIEAIVAGGTPGGMPAFSEALSEEERWAVTSYIRLQTFAQTPVEVAQAEVTAEPEEVVSTAESDATPTVEAPALAEGGPVVIAGRVTNASGGGVPEGLNVELVGYDGMQESSRQSAAVQPDGSFRFDEVEVSEARVYLASVDYQGVTYNSDVLHPDQLLALGGVDDLVISLYETTNDPSALVADRMHVFFEQTQNGTIQVVQLFILNNRGNTVIAPAGPDQPVITVDLPAGATNLQFQDGVLGDKYIATENGFGDLHTILPGSGAQLMFGYEIPARPKIDLELHVPLRVESAVVMMPVSGLNLESDQLIPAGERPVEGMRLNLYTSGAFDKGETINMTLSTGSSLVSIDSSSTSMIVGGLGLGLVLVGVGFWYVRRRSLSEEEEEIEEEDAVDETEESILDAIIALDDRFRAGELPEDAYRQRRAELKARLRSLQGGK